LTTIASKLAPTRDFHQAKKNGAPTKRTVKP